MIECNKCGRLIMDYYEQVHLMVKEMDSPDKAFFWCDDCYNGIEL